MEINSIKFANPVKTPFNAACNFISASGNKTKITEDRGWIILEFENGSIVKTPIANVDYVVCAQPVIVAKK
jgi:hypothetical protein